MPVPLRTTYHKAEAKYNVTTEFPALGLHSAAANGNVGLVEYALDHGQPVNSVLDGVLPLHAACAGGNVQVVKLLIDHGADVNAPRLPRRYSNDKSRDSSAPIVGSSGSTPLHFAAANGNTDVVKLLLLHGAHADRPDKHGITPEILAKQNGWIECANVLKSWILNKDRDLRERAGPVEDTTAASSNGTHRDHPVPTNSEQESLTSSPRKRLHVKHSIDTALNMLKSSSSNLTESYKRAQHPSSTPTPPASPMKPFGEYTFHTSDNAGSDSPVDPDSRRPSLPHIFPPPADLPIPQRSFPPASSAKLRRPRSAGAGADRPPEKEQMFPIYGRGGSGRKLGSKYSLMNMFKKGQGEEGGHSESASTTQASILSSSSAHFGSTTTLPLSSSPSQSANLSMLSRSSNVDINDTLNSQGPSSAPFSRSGFRFHRGSDASTRSTSQQQLSQDRPSPQQRPSSNMRSPRATIPLAIDLHNSIAQHQRTRDRSRSTSGQVPGHASDEVVAGTSPSSNSSPLSRLTALRVQGHKRHRSGSGGSFTMDSSPGNRSAVFLDDDTAAASLSAGAEAEMARPPARPGILRAHNRTSSNGHGSGSSAAFRALRFESNSSMSSGEQKGRESPHGDMARLRSSSSVGSLTKFKSRITNEVRPEDTESSTTTVSRDIASAPAAVIDFDLPPGDDIEEGDEGNERDEFDYGRPIQPDDLAAAVGPATNSQVRDALLLARQRGMSFTSSQSSLSPILSNDGAATDGTSSLNKDFPFSINRPPLLPAEDNLPSSHSHSLLGVPSLADNRGRGDSLSSIGTTDSQNNPQLSISGTTSSGESFIVSTPAANDDVTLPNTPNLENTDKPSAEVPDDIFTDTNAPNISSTIAHHITDKRTNIPHIDISSISSYAQAEALVEQARREVLELASVQEISPGTASSGRTPLSAKLAAYGEILALEKKLKEKCNAEVPDQPSESHDSGTSPAPSKTVESREGSGTPIPVAPAFNRKGRDGVERQHSLESKSGPGKLRTRMKDPRRPSTADGPSPRLLNPSLSSDHSRSHLVSRSASGSGHPRPQLAIDEEPASRSETNVNILITEVSNQPVSAPAISRETSNIDYDHSSEGSLAPVPRVEQEETLSRVSSLDGISTDNELGPPLFRVSTAPSGPVPARGKREQVRSAKKLTRMGLPPNEQGARAPSTPAPKRFGAIKSLMQTFKGKP